LKKAIQEVQTSVQLHARMRAHPRALVHATTRPCAYPDARLASHADAEARPRKGGTGGVTSLRTNSFNCGSNAL